MDDKNIQEIEEITQEYQEEKEIIEYIEQKSSGQALSKAKKIENSLKEKQKSILSTLNEYRSKNTQDLLKFVGWLLIFAGLIYFKNNVWNQLSILKSILYHLSLVISFFCMLFKLGDLNKNRKTKIDSKFELSIIEDDIFLEEIKGLSYEEKALKQLSKKQVDIERYHNLNLAHTKFIFRIGVFIIFIGIAIIACTILTTFFYEDTLQLIVIVSGFIGGLLVDAVGGIFILMYTKTIETANEYQTNMVETANTYLGNVLVAQISDNELREQTLAVMAKELVQRDKISGNLMKSK